MVLHESDKSNKTNYIYNRTDADLCFQKHTHYSFEVVTVTDGELICEIDNISYTLKKNQVLLILPGQIHSYFTPTSSKSELCVFSIDHIENFYSHIKGNRLSAPVIDVPDAKELFTVLQDDSNTFIKQSVMFYICGTALAQSELLPVPRDSSTLANLLAFYIQNNYTKKISLKELADECNYNYNYLSSFFGETFGMNFSAYVNEFRLQYAAKLLETTDIDIAKIVTMSGFATTRNFNVAFKKKYSLSPKEYRSTKSPLN